MFWQQGIPEHRWSESSTQHFLIIFNGLKPLEQKLVPEFLDEGLRTFVYVDGWIFLQLISRGSSWLFLCHVGPDASIIFQMITISIGVCNFGAVARTRHGALLHCNLQLAFSCLMKRVMVCHAKRLPPRI